MVVAHVERATATLTEAVPSTRFAGRPLPDTLAVFETELRSASRGMPGWRRPELEREWRAAEDGLTEALARAERVRLSAPDPEGFEGLIGLIGDLLAPLEPFEGVVDGFRRLRV